MEFNWRLENKSECYDRLLSWWGSHKAFGGKVIPYESMPNRVFTVYTDNSDVFSVAVYISDSDICWIGWITSNPDSKLKDKAGALEYLYGIITIVMKSLGFKQIISKTNESGLSKALDRSGFTFVEKSSFYTKKI